MESSGVFMYKITSSANSISLTSSFLIWMIFISISGLVALARASNTIMNNSGKCGHPRDRFQFFIVQYDDSCDYHVWSLLCWSIFFWYPFYWVFLSSVDIESCQLLFMYLLRWTGRPGVLQSMGSQRVGHDLVTELNWNELRWSHDFYLSFFNMVYHDRFAVIEPSLNPWNEYHFI